MFTRFLRHHRFPVTSPLISCITSCSTWRDLCWWGSWYICNKCKPLRKSCNASFWLFKTLQLIPPFFLFCFPVRAVKFCTTLVCKRRHVAKRHSLWHLLMPSLLELSCSTDVNRMFFVLFCFFKKRTVRQAKKREEMFVQRLEGIMQVINVCMQNKVFGLVGGFFMLDTKKKKNQSDHIRVSESEWLTTHHHSKHVDNLQVYGETSLVGYNLYSQYNPTA